MTQFTKINIKTFLHKERMYKHIMFITITSLLLLIVTLITSVQLWSFYIKKAQAKENNVFTYTKEAKKADLEAIILNRQTYLNKIAKEHIKTKHIRVFNNKKDITQTRKKTKLYNSNKWTDEKVVKKAMEFLRKKEGVRYKAYWDFKQWSICYWMKSKKGAVVTHKQCEKQLKERVQNELLKINRSWDNLSWNKKVALISFFYNAWYKHNIMMYAKRNDHNSVTYLMNKYIYSNWKVLKWLVNRRAEEIAFYKQTF